MTGMDFSGASTQQFGNDGELIPAGTLAWAVVHVRPHNIDQGIVVVPSKNKPENGYLDLELTIDDGPHARRKLWDMVGVRGSEQYTQGGFAAIRHMLESGRGAGPNNRQGYILGAGLPDLGPDGRPNEMGFMDLDGLRVAIRITVEKSKNPEYPDKNRARYLSPNPESDTSKDFARLMAGDTAPKVTAPAATTARAAGPAAVAAPWAQQPAPAAQPAPQPAPAAPAPAAAWGAPAPAANGKPGWLPTPTAAGGFLPQKTA